MDIKALLGTVVSPESLEGMSRAAGVSTDEVEKVLNAALPSLLEGAKGQADNADTAESFAGALSQHAADDVTDLSAFLGGVDTEDGAKIVNHLLGSDSGAVDQIADRAGLGSNKTLMILALAAPLLMSLLGKETNTQQQQNSGLGVSGIMGSLLGGLGGSTGSSAASAGIGGSLLSSLLGGGSTAASQQSSGSESSSGGLFGLLSGLLK